MPTRPHPSATRRRSATHRPISSRSLARRSKAARRLEPVRYAVIGLGYISQAAVLPAFSNAKRNSRLAALVSDDPRKLRELGRKYGIELLCRYADVDKLFNSGAIDAVYIALPNSLHAEYAIRAAEAGLHVLCEKPMAVTSHECQNMISAAHARQVKLMVAYRLHLEPGTLAVADLVRSGKLGELRFFTSQFSMQVKRDNIRVRRDAGGGPLYDIGVYCINAARMLFNAEPIEVFATAVTHPDPRFAAVPESASVIMKFPGHGLAAFTCGFGAASRSVYEIVGTKGSITVDPGYEMTEGIAYRMRVGDRTRSRQFSKSDQFAPELLYFSDCIRRGRDPEPSGEEGLADIAVIEALNRSILDGKWVSVDSPPSRRRPGRLQAIRRPAVRLPKMVRAEPPHTD